MEKSTIISQVKATANLLYSTEDNIEQSIANIGAMISQLSELKEATSATIFHGQEILTDIADLLNGLTSCRQTIASLHKSLLSGYEDLGIGPFAFGPVGKPTGALPHPAANSQAA